MIDRRVAIMWEDAKSIKDRDAYVSDWALSSIWDDDIPDDIIDDIPDEKVILERAVYAGKIWDAVHMHLKDLVKQTGLSQGSFGAQYCIATSTVEAWCRGTRTPPDYVKLLLASDLGLI